MTQADVPVFNIDEERRIFTLGNRRLESVTETLAGVGLIDPRWFKTIHSVRGMRVHAYCQYIHDGENVADTLKMAAEDKSWDCGKGMEPYFPEDPDIGLDGCVESIRKRMVSEGFTEFLDIERRLYHHDLFYTGRPDYRAKRRNDEWILDVKPEGHKKADEFQTAAYDPLFGKYAGVRKRASLHYQRDGKEAEFREHRDYYDFSHFVCFLDTFRQLKSLNIKIVRI